MPKYGINTMKYSFYFKSCNIVRSSSLYLYTYFPINYSFLGNLLISKLRADKIFLNTFFLKHIKGR